MHCEGYRLVRSRSEEFQTVNASSAEIGIRLPLSLAAAAYTGASAAT
jgi:hypothetical protein